MFYIIDILIISNYNNSTDTELKKILLQQFKDNNEYKKNKYVNYKLQIQGVPKVGIQYIVYCIPTFGTPCIYLVTLLISTLLCYVYTVTVLHTLNTTTTEVTTKLQD